MIQGSADPGAPHEALSEEIDIGLVLPCNVVVYQGDEAGSSIVAVRDPAVQPGVAERRDVEPMAQEARKRMVRALEAF